MPPALRLGMTTEMTVTRALSEIKLLDKRIRAKTAEHLKVAALARGQESVPGFESREAFTKQASAAVQSVKALIERRAALKSAIVLSNATTEVDVAGRRMTVAEAIEYKASIGYEKELLARLSAQLGGTTEEVEKKNAMVRAEADKRTDAALGDGARDSKASEYQAIFDSYLERNAYSVVAPKDLADTIETLRDEISDFEYQVDFTLSEVNALTRISVND